MEAVTHCVVQGIPERAGVTELHELLKEAVATLLLRGRQMICAPVSMMLGVAIGEMTRFHDVVDVCSIQEAKRGSE